MKENRHATAARPRAADEREPARPRAADERESARPRVADTDIALHHIRQRRLAIASHNAGKVGEIAALLRPLGIETATAAALGLAAPEETGASFEANAALKATRAAAACGLPALADDSGLEVAALGGRPGVHSARWGGPQRDFAAAMARIKRELAGHGDRRARFRCVLALAFPEGGVASFEGRVEGRLVFPPRGSRGFGYDPIFVPEGAAKSFAEMSAAGKRAFSHRARAFARLRAALAPPRTP